MKQILYIIGLAVLLSVINTSCKKNSMDVLRDNEIVALDKYVKDNNLTDSLDVSGIYFSLEERSSDTTLIRSGSKVMIDFKVTLIDGSDIPVDYYFTTDDGLGHNYESRAFYVDISNTVVNQEYIQQIAGLHVGLKKMHIGDRAFMVIPSAQAFKGVDNSYFGIPSYSTLLVTVSVKNAYAYGDY